MELVARSEKGAEVRRRGGSPRHLQEQLMTPSLVAEPMGTAFPTTM
jgi:hypothetical protein